MESPEAHPSIREPYIDFLPAHHKSNIRNDTVAFSDGTAPLSESNFLWDCRFPTTCPSESIPSTLLNEHQSAVHVASVLSNADAKNEYCRSESSIESYKAPNPTGICLFHTQKDIACGQHTWEVILTPNELDVPLSATNSTVKPPSSESSDDTSSSRTGMKRKREYGEHDDEAQGDGNNDGDDPESQCKRSSKSKRQAENVLRFACPFYQHDTSKYGAFRACNGPGWPSIYRLKEHIFRSHKPVLDEELKAALKRRASKYRSQTEEQKWSEIYQLLFPECPENAIPRPFYDQQESSNCTQKKILESLKEELPRIIAGRIQHRPPSGVPDDLSSLQALVTQSVDNILRRFSEPPAISSSESKSLLNYTVTPSLEFPDSGLSLPTTMMEAWEDTTAVSQGNFVVAPYSNNFGGCGVDMNETTPRSFFSQSWGYHRSHPSESFRDDETSGAALGNGSDVT